MNRTALTRFTFLLSTVLTTAALPALAQQPAVPAHWAGTATVRGQEIPVRIDLTPGTHGNITGSFRNGDEISTSSSGELNGGHLILHFDYFARKLEGELTATTLTATYGGATGQPATLALHPDLTAAAKATPGKTDASLDGDWEVAVQSPKGESAWTLRISPFGEPGHIKAVILRIDGDTGGLYGSYDPAQGAYVVSRFAASGGSLYTIKPQTDGTLLLATTSRQNQQWTARRPAEARKENLAPPTRPTEQTGLIDPAKSLEFSAPALDTGTTVRSTDPQFKGKVVIVAIGGSWCPNCHDEAPFLVELYNRFHARGLEIVNLSFEEADQLKDPTRLRAFKAKYHIPYTILVAGTPDDLSAKIPQGKNLNCRPTSFFIGRDGLVKETHAGFSGPATGAAYTELKAETATLVETLLAAKPSPALSAKTETP